MNQITENIIKAAITVHRELGPVLGLLINFNETKLVDGLVRVANRYGD